MSHRIYSYGCRVLRVVDADTMDLDIDLGFGVWFKTRIRIRGYDAPETRRIERQGERVTEAEVARGTQAKLYAERLLLRDAQAVRVQTDRYEKGRYGRWIAALFIDRGRGWERYAELMVARGYVR